MQKNIQLKLLPSEASTDSGLKESAALAIGCPVEEIKGFTILKRSIDARSRQAWFILTLRVFVNEPPQPETSRFVNMAFPNVCSAKNSVIIIGAGPAGLFAALKLIEAGIQPI